MSDLARLIEEALATPLVGWDTSYGGRITAVDPWDYTAMVVVAARNSPDLLDMGTGGGEWLSRLPYRPPRTVATEGWPPNVPVAQARLRPLGIEVVAVEGAPDNVDQDGDAPGGDLPFADGSFQLVVNRHESYLPREVRRVLAPDGLFLTQQVGSGVADDLRRLLTGEPPEPAARSWTREVAVGQVEAAGFKVEDSGDGDQIVSFADVGALVWYLVHLPWVWPDFSLDAHRDALTRLHEQARGGATLSARQPLFWLRARAI
jgi:SAM-dependent methyltransferase